MYVFFLTSVIPDQKENIKKKDIIDKHQSIIQGFKPKNISVSMIAINKNNTNTNSNDIKSLKGSLEEEINQDIIERERTDEITEIINAIYLLKTKNKCPVNEVFIKKILEDNISSQEKLQQLRNVLSSMKSNENSTKLIESPIKTIELNDIDLVNGYENIPSKIIIDIQKNQKELQNQIKLLQVEINNIKHQMNEIKQDLEHNNQHIEDILKKIENFLIIDSGSHNPVSALKLEIEMLKKYYVSPAELKQLINRIHVLESTIHQLSLVVKQYQYLYDSILSRKKN